MRKLLNVLLKSLKSLVSGALLVASFILLASQVPQIHSSFIRNYVGNKVVRIMNNGRGGTGFHVNGKSGETYIVTNNHICLLADKNEVLNVYKQGSKIPIKRKVIFRHPSHDLCLVEGLPGVKGLRVAYRTGVGENVGLIGHPALRPLTLARGEIIGSRKISLFVGANMPKERCFGEMIYIESLEKKGVNRTDDEDAILWLMYLNGIKNLCYAENLESTMLNGISFPGNSGSPVVNFFGNIVGVLFAGSNQLTDAYLVPLDVLQDFLKDF